MSAMDETALAPGEQLVLRLHPHWKVLLRPLVLLVLIALAVLLLLIVLPLGQYAAVSRLAVAAVGLLAVVIWVAVPLLRWRTTLYELTTRRFRLRSGLLTRTGRDFPLLRISDVSFSRGPLDRLLGCGRLVVESAGEHGQLVLTEIPGVERVQSLMFHLVEYEQTRLAREDR